VRVRRACCSHQELRRRYSLPARDGLRCSQAGYIQIHTHRIFCLFTATHLTQRRLCFRWVWGAAQHDPIRGTHARERQELQHRELSLGAMHCVRRFVLSCEYSSSCRPVFMFSLISFSTASILAVGIETWKTMISDDRVVSFQLVSELGGYQLGAHVVVSEPADHDPFSELGGPSEPALVLGISRRKCWVHPDSYPPNLLPVYRHASHTAAIVLQMLEVGRVQGTTEWNKAHFAACASAVLPRAPTAASSPWLLLCVCTCITLRATRSA
jgi:hypothetical protein